LTREIWSHFLDELESLEFIRVAVVPPKATAGQKKITRDVIDVVNLWNILEEKS